MTRLEALRSLEKAATAGDALAAYNHDLSRGLIRFQRNYERGTGIRLTSGELAAMWEQFVQGEADQTLGEALQHGQALISIEEAKNNG